MPCPEHTTAASLAGTGSVILVETRPPVFPAGCQYPGKAGAIGPPPRSASRRFAIASKVDALIRSSSLTNVPTAAPYDSPGTNTYQRLTVIASDALLLVGTRALACAPSAPSARRATAPAPLAAVALTFLNAGLLLVDHVHFQYNGMMADPSPHPHPHHHHHPNANPNSNANANPNPNLNQA